MVGNISLYLHGQSNTSSVNPKNSIKHTDSNAELQSSN